LKSNSYKSNFQKGNEADKSSIEHPTTPFDKRLSMGAPVGNSFDNSSVQKVYGNNNKKDLFKAFNSQNIFTSNKYATMNQKERHNPWND
jgi:hypothetical protein